MFAIARREAGDGNEACKLCELLPTKPGFVSEENAKFEESEELFQETASLIREKDVEGKINWQIHDPELFPLVEEWVATEKEIALIHSCRIQAFIKSWCEKDK
jgi:hypothetical protein